MLFPPPGLAKKRRDEYAMPSNGLSPFFFASILRQNPDKNQRHVKMGAIQAHSEQDNSKQKWYAMVFPSILD